MGNSLTSLPWALIDTAQVPGDGGELRLWQRGDEFSIRLGNNPLMNSRVFGSEEALAKIACAKIASRARPQQILIGGLGMGFTLRAALEVLGPDAQIVVAELVSAVVAWNRGPLSTLSGDCLTDARVNIREIDVAHLIQSKQAAYDAILLDVDNGPDGLTHRDNDQLYDLNGLMAAHAALRPGGVLAIWSSQPDQKFTRRLGTMGFVVEEVPVRAYKSNRKARHIVWVATRPL
jgi:spermidine synthase